MSAEIEPLAHPVIDGAPLAPGEQVVVTTRDGDLTTTYRGPLGGRVARVGATGEHTRLVGFSQILRRVTPLPAPKIEAAVPVHRLRAVIDDFRPLATTDELRAILARLEGL